MLTLTSNSSLGDKEQYIGRMPEFELLISPRWVVASGDEGYRRPQLGVVRITNRERETVVFRLRARDRQVVQFERAYGLIRAGASTDVGLVVTGADQWHRDPNDFAGRRVRVVVESLLLPARVREPPQSQPQVNAFGKKLFQVTATNAPMTRMYTKLSVLLPRIPEDYALIEQNAAKAHI